MNDTTKDKQNIISLLKSKDKASQGLGLNLMESQSIDIPEFFDPLEVIYDLLPRAVLYTDEDLLEIYHINYLDLSSIDFSNQMDKLNNLKVLDNLKYLHMQSCNLQEIPQIIYEMPNIEGLGLAYNDIKEVPEDILNLQNLQWIWLSRNKNLTNIPALYKLSKLRRVSIYNTRLTPSNPNLANIIIL